MTASAVLILDRAGGIRIITPPGKVLGQIKLPEVAANPGFGEDGHALYIAASTSRRPS